MTKKAAKTVHLPDLYRLWNSERTTQQVHEELGISYSQLMRLVAQHKLGKKPRLQPEIETDPTPEEIAERAAAIRLARESKGRLHATSHGSRTFTEPRWTAPSYSYNERTGIFRHMS